MTPAVSVPNKMNQLPLLTSRRLRALGLALFALVVLSLASLVAIQYRDELQHAHERHELLARVLEDHTTRTLDSAAMGMAAVAGMIVSGEPANSAGVLRAMQQTLVNQMQLRSLSLMDAKGRVLAAAGEQPPGDVNLDALAPLPEQSQPLLGRVRWGRGLPMRSGEESVPAGLVTLPFVQRVAAPGGSPLYLVGLLNPDYFANAQVQTLNDARLAAALVRFDGQCVAATESSAVNAGDELGHLLPVAQQRLEAGRASWVGDGLHPGRRVASFRALRPYPLFVMVEMDHGEVVEKALVDVAGVAAAALMAALLVLLLTTYASREQAARELAQRSLQEAQSRLVERGRELDGVFASVQELIFRTDGAGKVSFINARWEHTTGRPVAQAIGKPLAELFSPTSRAGVQALLQAPQRDSVRQAQVLIDGPDHHTRRLDLTLVPLLDGGVPVGYAGSAVDVTDLAQSQAQLQAQLAFNASMIESNPLPVVVRDTSNRYLRVNHAWEAFTGRSRNHVIGTLASVAHPPEHAAVHEQKDQELLQRGQGEIRYEAKIFRADGALRDIYVTKALIADADGRPVAILAAFMDISEIREAERMTRLARDTAVAASAAKTEFIANVSHELRTPLQSILGFSEIGARRAEAQVRLAAMFGDIHRAGHRMLALVNDLLDLSKLDRKGIELTLLRQDLHLIVAEAVDELRLLAAARSVQLQLGAAPSALIAEADAPRVSQVLRNLLANAIRFSPSSSIVEIEFECRTQPGGSEIELRIADRGPGIPPEELENIFEAFVQSSKTKDGAGGTGLGLTISRRIVEAHGGRLWASNRAGGGAVFTLVLPGAAGGRAPAPEPAPEAVARGV